MKFINHLDNLNAKINNTKWKIIIQNSYSRVCSKTSKSQLLPSITLISLKKKNPHKKTKRIFTNLNFRQQEQNPRQLYFCQGAVLKMELKLLKLALLLFVYQDMEWISNALVPQTINTILSISWLKSLLAWSNWLYKTFP